MSRTGAAFSPALVASRTSLREQVTEVLRGSVITGAMRPGELYSVPALAEKFGVSATPVREAMLDLVTEGLIEAVRNKGFRVTEPTDEQLDDLNDLRMLIEVPTCARLAEAYSSAWDAELAELRALAAEIVSYAESRDLVAYVEADRHFHLRLLALAGNDELVDVVGRLRARSRLYGLERLARQGTLGRSAAEHFELMEAVMARDPARAADVMRRHIHHVRGLWAGRPDEAVAEVDASLRASAVAEVRRGAEGAARDEAAAEAVPARAANRDR